MNAMHLCRLLYLGLIALSTALLVLATDEVQNDVYTPEELTIDALKYVYRALTSEKLAPGSTFVHMRGVTWCGAGWAHRPREGELSFGRYAMSDNCCRRHDMCSDYILPGQTIDGFRNDVLVTLSSCDCDNALAACLGDASLHEERMPCVVYAIYFRWLKMRCFKKTFNHTTGMHDVRISMAKPDMDGLLSRCKYTENNRYDPFFGVIAKFFKGEYQQLLNPDTWENVIETVGKWSAKVKGVSAMLSKYLSAYFSNDD